MHQFQALRLLHIAVLLSSQGLGPALCTPVLGVANAGAKNVIAHCWGPITSNYVGGLEPLPLFKSITVWLSRSARRAGASQSRAKTAKEIPAVNALLHAVFHPVRIIKKQLNSLLEHLIERWPETWLLAIPIAIKATINLIDEGTSRIFPARNALIL